MSQKIEKYKLEKSIWNDEDFSQMGWHDCLIHSFATRIFDEKEPWKNEFLLDVDYIFKWNQPIPPSSYFTFWISPCTLIFENFYDLIIEIDTSYAFPFAQIMGLNRKEIKNEINGLIYYEWKIELENGLISLKSENFQQIVRKKPIYSKGQWLSFEERKGFSFDKKPIKIK